MIMANEVETPVKVGEPPEPEVQEIERTLVRLPNGKAIPAESLEQFIDKAVDHGISRKYWVDEKKLLEREEYDGILDLLNKVNLITGRKKGHAGRLLTQNPARIRSKLGLV